jgi:sugar/nucleoside kinase (ribokinase family)
MILVESGKDKRFVSDIGANPTLSFEHVVRALRASSPRVLYLACGILGRFDIRIREVFRLCREMGVLTMLDVLQPLGKDWDFIRPALPFTDVIHSNQQELTGITGSSDPREGLKFLARKGVGLSIFSDADRGVVALYKDRFLVQPSFRVEAIDPTGAGDALCAGIAKTLSSLPQGVARFHDGLTDAYLSRMLLYSQAAGAACVGEIGTTAGVTKARVRRLVSTQGEGILRRTVVQ